MGFFSFKLFFLCRSLAPRRIGRSLELRWPAFRERVGGAALLLRASGVLLAIGAVDLSGTAARLPRELRRSKQEIAEEAKDQESARA